MKITFKKIKFALKKYVFQRSKWNFPKHLEHLDALRCETAYNKYGGYCVPLNSRHRPAARKVLSNNVYEPDTIDFMCKHAGAGDIVHAGTFFGDFLPALSRAVHADAKIWAFEPNRESYRCASITLAINDIRNVHLAHAGLGDQERASYVRTRNEHGAALGGKSHIVSEAGTPGADRVNILAVDDVVGDARKVSIVQLDVEGSEKEALSGALKTIRRCHPIIILETRPEDDLLESEWFKKNILDLGYERHGDIHRNAVFMATRLPCSNGNQG